MLDLQGAVCTPPPTPEFEDAKAPIVNGRRQCPDCGKPLAYCGDPHGIAILRSEEIKVGPDVAKHAPAVAIVTPGGFTSLKVEALAKYLTAWFGPTMGLPQERILQAFNQAVQEGRIAARDNENNTKESSNG